MFFFYFCKLEYKCRSYAAQRLLRRNICRGLENRNNKVPQKFVFFLGSKVGSWQNLDKIVFFPGKKNRSLGQNIFPCIGSLNLFLSNLRKIRNQFEGIFSWRSIIRRKFPQKSVLEDHYTMFLADNQVFFSDPYLKFVLVLIIGLRWCK